uniref:Gamma interferon inducible lysosomal thiol reductase (GILT) protein n=1 Tax=Toxoplasma gondii COUG TaxID=1074873 RepID=A0A2G8XLD6_TOXGO|nr:gamma interferon inducible lysosomal thiol reductase (GILT) protein [Toxoplasma gondii COUG]
MADIRTCAEAFFAFFLAVSLPFCGSASGATAQNSVKVDILYESKCPFCFSWLKEELHPAVEHLGDDVLRKANIVFDPLPFGNAKEIPDGKGGFSFECQHGQSECYLNKVEVSLVLQRKAGRSPLLLSRYERAFSLLNPDVDYGRHMQI